MTFEAIQANDAKLQQLGAEVEEASGGDQQRLLIEFLECAKAQEALLAATPGMEDDARQIREMRLEAQEHYGL